MRMEIVYRSKEPYPYEKHPAICSTGGYEAKKDGKTINFDFTESCGNTQIEDGYLVLDIRCKNIEIYSEDGTETIYSDDSDEDCKIELDGNDFKGLHISDFMEIFYECFYDEVESIHIPMEPIEIEFDLRGELFEVDFKSA